MFVADVGSVAPVLALRDAQARHRPRMLVFVRTWSLDDELPHVQARLRELDTELVIVGPEGVWSFTADRIRSPVFCDRLAVNAANAAGAYGVRGDAVFIIDHRNVVRFVHRPERSLDGTVVEALDAAAEALCWRQHQTRLERVQWTPREWASKCLVVGCALTFEGVATASRTRFARGTGPVCTPRAATGAPMSRPCGISEHPTLLSPRRDD